MQRDSVLRSQAPRRAGRALGAPLHKRRSSLPTGPSPNRTFYKPDNTSPCESFLERSRLQRLPGLSAATPARPRKRRRPWTSRAPGDTKVHTDRRMPAQRSRHSFTGTHMQLHTQTGQPAQLCDMRLGSQAHSATAAALPFEPKVLQALMNSLLNTRMERRRPEHAARRDHSRRKVRPRAQVSLPRGTGLAASPRRVRVPKAGIP